MHNKKYFCYEIYKNLAIFSKQNKIIYAPCCIYDTSPMAETAEIDIEEVWNGPDRQKLKDAIANDQPIPGCRTCYVEEEAGRKSRRMQTKELYEKFYNDIDINLSSPQALDYSVGNLCNLKCVICGPHSSTSWISDYKKMFPNRSVKQYQYNKNLQKLLDNEKQLENIKTLHIHGGGEPLLNGHHLSILKKIDEVKGLSDVRVSYNTNGTQLPDDKTLKIWEKCLLVELHFSIDDIGNRFEYQRTGTSWPYVIETIDNIKKIMPHNHLFYINCVWSMLNIYYLDELFDWYTDSLYTNRYGDPTNLHLQKANGQTGVTVLPKDVKQKLIAKFSNYNRLQDLVENIPTGHDNYEGFWHYINRLDKIRGRQFETVHSEWSKLIKHTDQ